MKVLTIICLTIVVLLPITGFSLFPETVDYDIELDKRKVEANYEDAIAEREQQFLEAEERVRAEMNMDWDTYYQSHHPERYEHRQQGEQQPIALKHRTWKLPIWLSIVLIMLIAIIILIIHRTTPDRPAG